MLLRTLSDLAVERAEPRLYNDPRWGRENCILLRRARRAEPGPSVHTLSIRAAWGGTELCRVDGRDLGIDDDNFLILNHGRCYSTSIRALHPVESLTSTSVPGWPSDACGAMAVSLERALVRRPTVSRRSSPSSSRTCSRTTAASRRCCSSFERTRCKGVDDESWYEEQLHFLLERMQRHRSAIAGPESQSLRLHAGRDAARGVPPHRPGH